MISSKCGPVALTVCVAVCSTAADVIAAPRPERDASVDTWKTGTDLVCDRFARPSYAAPAAGDVAFGPACSLRPRAPGVGTTTATTRPAAGMVSWMEALRALPGSKAATRPWESTVGGTPIHVRVLPTVLHGRYGMLVLGSF